MASESLEKTEIAISSVFNISSRETVKVPFFHYWDFLQAKRSFKFLSIIPDPLTLTLNSEFRG